MGREAGVGRYARPEREQRWLLVRRPDEARQPVSIVDRYIRGTRLRLRRMESGAEVIYKFGQKVRPHGGGPALVQLTNIYLSDHEYTVLRALDADEIHKTRWHVAVGGRTVAVDEFGGEHRGLILAEVELGADEPAQDAPPFAVADVTEDDRFSGGRLATTTASELRTLLAGHGVGPTP